MKNGRHNKDEREQRIRRSFMARDMAIHNRSRTFVDRKHEANRRACKQSQLEDNDDSGAEGE